MVDNRRFVLMRFDRNTKSNHSKSNCVTADVLCCFGAGAGAGFTGSVRADRGRPDPGGEPAASGCSWTWTSSGDAQRVSCGSRGDTPHTERRSR